jgi:hypothetical protein
MESECCITLSAAAAHAALLAATDRVDVEKCDILEGESGRLNVAIAHLVSNDRVRIGLLLNDHVDVQLEQLREDRQLVRQAAHGAAPTNVLGVQGDRVDALLLPVAELHRPRQTRHHRMLRVRLVGEEVGHLRAQMRVVRHDARGVERHDVEQTVALSAALENVAALQALPQIEAHPVIRRTAQLADDNAWPSISLPADGRPPHERMHGYTWAHPAAISARRSAC